VLTLATARTRRRTALGGVLLGLAIATKLTPALAVPALLRRRWLTVALAASSAFAAVYVPHVLTVGTKVIGFLPGYLKQEGYSGGTRFGIIGLFATSWLAVVLAVLILGAVAFAVLQFGNPDRPWEGAVVMTGAALAVTTPHFQWYSLLLVMLVALDGRPEWLAFAAGGYYAAEPSMGRFTVPYRFLDAFAYGSAVLIVAAGWLIRHEIARRGLGTARPAPVMVSSAVTAPVMASSAVTAPVTTAGSAITAPVTAGSAATAPAMAGAAVTAPGAQDDSFDAFTPKSVSVRRRPGVRV
jgi:hypothetical protein